MSVKKKIDFNSVLNEIFESEKYNYDSHESLIYDNIISNIIHNKLFLNNPFLSICKLLEAKLDKEVFSSNNLNIKIQYDKVNNNVKFVSDKKIKISNTFIDEESGAILKSVSIPNDNTIKLNNSNGYSVLFCMIDGLYINSGFIIINNNNKEFYNYNIRVEVI